jgi:hypothetical protein
VSAILRADGTAAAVFSHNGSAVTEEPIMLKTLLASVGLTLALLGCAVEMVPLGTAQSDVIAKYGAPTRVVPIATGTRLQYSRQPAGRTAVMVDLDAAGRVASVRQVLNETDFARIVVGQWTRDIAEREFGRPSFVNHVASWKGDILTYRWFDLGRTEMFYYIYLDPNNTVQQVGQGMEFRDAREPRDVK